MTEPPEPLGPTAVDTEPVGAEPGLDPHCACGYPVWEDMAAGKPTCSWCGHRLDESENPGYRPGNPDWERDRDRDE